MGKVFTRASVGKPDSENEGRSSQATNGGSWFQAFLPKSVETGDENCDSLLIVLALRKQHNLQKKEESFGKNQAPVIRSSHIQRFRA